MKSSRPVRVLLLAVALLWLPAAAPAQKHKDVEKIGQRDINKGSWNLYSLEREIELGRRLSLDVEAQSRLRRGPRGPPPTKPPRRRSSSGSRTGRGPYSASPAARTLPCVRRPRRSCS